MRHLPDNQQPLDLRICWVASSWGWRALLPTVLPRCSLSLRSRVACSPAWRFRARVGLPLLLVQVPQQAAQQPVREVGSASWEAELQPVQWVPAPQQHSHLAMRVC
mmetsp:Transcript_14805/g.35079  ORF Transcript_14805/g.35079 Transcript_14805/m.35079 type:complete len:106 (+) Transcript_14805:1127-1444(+)